MGKKAEPKTFYIVWNEGRTEGFVTDDISDAKQAKSGKFQAIRSSAGEAFAELYDDDKRTMQEVVL